MAIWERDGHIIEDADGHPMECDTCPCPPPPDCILCLINAWRPGYVATNYLEIYGVACDEDCETTKPHLLGIYNQTEYAQTHPDWTGCVWWEWTALNCRTWYGVDHLCTISPICRQKVCNESDSGSEEFIPGKYRVVFDFDSYSSAMVEEKWEGFVRTCVLGEPYHSWIDPVYCFDSLDELQDYIDYVESSARSSTHTFTAGVGQDGNCALFMDGVEVIGEQHMDFKLNRYEYIGECYEGEEGNEHPVIPSAYSSEGDI